MIGNLVKTIGIWYWDNLSYSLITLLMVIESSFIPFPSEIVIPPAIWKAMLDGELNIFLIVIFGTLGALIGALVNYYLAYYIGRNIIYKLADMRFMRMMMISPESIEKAEEYFRKNGNSSTFVGRLIPGIRQLISIPAGLAKMDIKSFILYTTLGAFIWNVILAAIGYLVFKLAKNNLDKAQDLLHYYMDEISYVLLGLGVLFVIYLVMKSRKSKKSHSVGESKA